MVRLGVNLEVRLGASDDDDVLMMRNLVYIVVYITVEKYYNVCRVPIINN